MMTNDPSSDTPDAAALSARGSSVWLCSTATITPTFSARRARNDLLLWGLIVGPPHPDAFRRVYRSPLGGCVANKTIPPAKFRLYQMFGLVANRTQLGAQAVD